MHVWLRLIVALLSTVVLAVLTSSGVIQFVFHWVVFGFVLCVFVLFWEFKYGPRE